MHGFASVNCAARASCRLALLACTFGAARALHGVYACAGGVPMLTDNCLINAARASLAERSWDGPRHALCLAGLQTNWSILHVMRAADVMAAGIPLFLLAIAFIPRL